MLSFLKPNIPIAALFTILTFICIGGAIQTYTFVHDIPGIPKPPLYDLLRPFDLWAPWRFFTIPIDILSYTLGLSQLIHSLPNMDGIYFPLFSITYAYIVSCWTIYTWRRWLASAENRSTIPIMDAVLGALLASPSIYTIFNGKIENVIFAASSIMFTALIASIYTISIYGIYRMIRIFIQHAE